MKHTRDDRIVKLHMMIRTDWPRFTAELVKEIRQQEPDQDFIDSLARLLQAHVDQQIAKARCEPEGWNDKTIH